MLIVLSNDPCLIYKSRGENKSFVCTHKCMARIQRSSLPAKIPLDGVAKKFVDMADSPEKKGRVEDDFEIPVNRAVLWVCQINPNVSWNEKDDEEDKKALIECSICATTGSVKVFLRAEPILRHTEKYSVEKDEAKAKALFEACKRLDCLEQTRNLFAMAKAYPDMLKTESSHDIDELVAEFYRLVAESKDKDGWKATLECISKWRLLWHKTLWFQQFVPDDLKVHNPRLQAFGFAEGGIVSENRKRVRLLAKQVTELLHYLQRMRMAEAQQVCEAARLSEALVRQFVSSPKPDHRSIVDLLAKFISKMDEPSLSAQCSLTIPDHWSIVDWILKKAGIKCQPQQTKDDRAILQAWKKLPSGESKLGDLLFAKDTVSKDVIECTASINRAFPVQRDSQDIILYHGTSLGHAQLIYTHGIRLAEGKTFLDFNCKGAFYMTPDAHMAVDWAWKVDSEEPAVVVFRLRSDHDLKFKEFELGDAWKQFVYANRSHTMTDEDDAKYDAYDVIVGPVGKGHRYEAPEQVEHILANGRVYIQWALRTSKSARLFSRSIVGVFTCLE